MERTLSGDKPTPQVQCESKKRHPTHVDNFTKN